MRALSAKYPFIQLLKIDKATEGSTAAKLRDVILFHSHTPLTGTPSFSICAQSEAL